MLLVFAPRSFLCRYMIVKSMMYRSYVAFASSTCQQYSWGGNEMLGVRLVRRVQ